MVIGNVAWLGRRFPGEDLFTEVGMEGPHPDVPPP